MSQDPVANLEKLIDDIIEQGKQMFPERKSDLDEVFKALYQLQTMSLATLPNKELIELNNALRRIEDEVIRARMKPPSTSPSIQTLRRSGAAAIKEFDGILSVAFRTIMNVFVEELGFIFVPLVHDLAWGSAV